ncbi:MAG: hypothetical protein Q9198_003832, partial [Flavoplaca austrocitrina]
MREWSSLKSSSSNPSVSSSPASSRLARRHWSRASKRARRVMVGIWMIAARG